MGGNCPDDKLTLKEPNSPPRHVSEFAERKSTHCFHDKLDIRALKELK